MLGMIDDIKKGAVVAAPNIKPYWRYEMNNQFISRKEAISQGLTRYFTGKPCKNGHISERNSETRRCYQCRAEEHQEYYKKNKDKICARTSKYQKENPEIQKRSAKKYAQTDKAKITQRKKYEIAKENGYLEKCKKYRDENKERYSLLYSEKRIKRANKIKANTFKNATSKQIKKLLELQNHRCINCNVYLSDNKHLDHIVPISLGGGNDLNNLQWLCAPCNLSKKNKDPIKWAQENGRLF